MRFFKNLSDISLDFNFLPNIGMGKLFHTCKYYLQLFVLANFSLLAFRDFLARMYYFNCFSFFLGFIMSKYILAEELAQTAITFTNDLKDIYSNKVSGLLEESIIKFKSSVKNVEESIIKFKSSVKNVLEKKPEIVVSNEEPNKEPESNQEPNKESNQESNQEPETLENSVPMSSDEKKEQTNVLNPDQ